MKEAYLSNLAGEPLIVYLQEQGCKLHFMTGESSPVYDEIKTHADIHMCRFGVWDNPDIFIGDCIKLTSKYPGNIIYNAVCTKKYFIHNLKYTAPELIQAAKKWHASLPYDDLTGINKSEELVFVHVSQGYTRCCCLPVDDSSFITSDEGISKALTSAGADVLCIEKGHILLPGFDYGFIGGCAGHMPLIRSSLSTENSQKNIIFNGDLSRHPDFLLIRDFLEYHEVRSVFFENYPLMDIGSILIK